MWLLLSLLAALLWGIGRTFIKKGLDRVTPLWTNILDAFFFLVIFIPFSLLRGATFSIDPLMFGILIGISLLYILDFYGLEKGQLALAGTIIAAYPAVTILTATLFLGERLTQFQLVMIFFILLGGAIIGYTPNKMHQKRSQKTRSWFLWAVLVTISLGIGDFFAKVVISSVGADTYNLFFPLAFVIGIFMFWLVDKQGRKLPKGKNRSQLWFTGIGVAMEVLAFLAFNFALLFGQASLVSPVSSSYAGLNIILAVCFLHERVSRIQFVGIGLILTGIAFIGS